MHRPVAVAPIESRNFGDKLQCSKHMIRRIEAAIFGHHGTQTQNAPAFTAPSQ
jgi:hypothetical protein